MGLNEIKIERWTCIYENKRLKFKVEDLVKYIDESIGGETIIACARSDYRKIFNRYN